MSLPTRQLQTQDTTRAQMQQGLPIVNDSDIRTKTVRESP